MLFNSWEFALFAAVIFVCYYRLTHRGQNLMLLAASYIFYGAWDYRFLSLIFISTVVDYTIGLKLWQAKHPGYRRALLITSCSVNLGILGFFKYYNFFMDSAVALMAGMDMGVLDLRLDIVLPVGISFYTFQTMSYTIDIYRSKLKPTSNFFDFSLFVSFFPQLVAGPIERATNLLPQISRKRAILPHQWVQGGWLILLGLFKKSGHRG
jgi:D-alanyl-lipoteichoic acid acyltransferase DltB (MBOAT superfamily)